MPGKESSWKFAEEFVLEPGHIAAARAHADELGVESVSPGTGAQLAVVAAAAAASTIIEVGTGVGVSGLWLLAGSPDATITSIDVESDYQDSAKRAFLDAGAPANRIRMIGGSAVEVLPRMNELSYDLVLVDADPAHTIEYVEHALRLVRVGGIVLVPHALWRDRVADPASRGDTVGELRTLLKEISGSDAVISSLSPLGDGLLQLVKR